MTNNCRSLRLYHLIIIADTVQQFPFGIAHKKGFFYFIQFFGYVIFLMKLRITKNRNKNFFCQDMLYQHFVYFYQRNVGIYGVFAKFPKEVSFIYEAPFSPPIGGVRGGNHFSQRPYNFGNIIFKILNCFVKILDFGVFIRRKSRKNFVQFLRISQVRSHYSFAFLIQNSGFAILKQDICFGVSCIKFGYYFFF